MITALRRITPAVTSIYAVKIAWHILVLACLMWAIGQYLNKFDASGLNRHHEYRYKTK